MIYDVVTYNGEADLFDIRYNILKSDVNEFIVIEFDKTFSGRPKESSFKQMYSKVKYFFVKEEQYMKYLELAKSSPNTEYGKGAEHWLREFCQKESIKDCLAHLKDDDIVFVSDCDEVWNPNIPHGDTSPTKLKLKVYTYYLNNRSSEEFCGTLRASYKYTKGCLNHLRTNAPKTAIDCGWHFTSMAKDLNRKLQDSYTSESYATEAILSNLDKNVAENKDFLGRDFTYKIDESQWPDYLKINRDKYAHLLNHNPSL